MKQAMKELFLMILCFFFIIPAAITAARILKSDQSISFYENRVLAAAPDLTVQGIWNGEFASQADEFLSDNFWGRNTLIRIDTAIDLALKRPVSHGVVVTQECLLPFHGYEIWDLDYLAEQASAMSERLSGIRDIVEENEGIFIYLGIPQQYSYFSNYYPEYMDDRTWVIKRIHSEFASAMSEYDVSFLDATSIYDDLGHPDYFYSTSDHHYTYQGMLVAYQSLMEEICSQMGKSLKIYTQNDLEMYRLPNTFLGSQNRKLYGLWQEEEKLEVAQLKDEISFRRIDNGTAVDAVLYSLPENEDIDISYSVYMGGDIGETIIQTNRQELPDILIWGDSFTNPMETIIWASFNESRFLDFRYYTEMELSEYIEAHHPDVVVCIRDDTSYLDSTGNGAVA